MASETSGDNSDSHGSLSMEPKGSNFKFRPSALSDVADKMWKNTSSSSGSDGHSTVLTLPKLSAGANTNNNVFISASSSQFIFGKNIMNRVAHGMTAGANGSSDACSASEKGDGTGVKASSPKDEASENKGGTKGGFDAIVANSAASASTSFSNNSALNAAKSEMSAADDTAASLEEAAAAYEAAKQSSKQPNLLAPEDIKTGEEDEVNVVQASVKLYVFDAAKHSWTDRGLAVMRVNDRSDFAEENEANKTRIVVRLQGSLRVIVNTKLWPDMLLERVSPKRLRLSGTLVESIVGNGDSKKAPSITVYLITGSQPDIDRIETALRDRLGRLKVEEDRVTAVAGKKRALEQPESPSSSKDSDQGESPAKKRELTNE